MELLRAQHEKHENIQNNIGGMRIVCVTPDNAILSYSFALRKVCSNNIAEYEVVIVGLELALQSSITNLKLFGD